MGLDPSYTLSEMDRFEQSMSAGAMENGGGAAMSGSGFPAAGHPHMMMPSPVQPPLPPFGTPTGDNFCPPPGYVPPPPGYMPRPGWQPPLPTGFRPPPPPLHATQRPRAPAVISAAPKSYSSRPQINKPTKMKMKKDTSSTAARPPTLNQLPAASDGVKTSAQLMAERVAASTVTVTESAPPPDADSGSADPAEQTAQPSTSAAGDDGGGGKKKKKQRPKKFLRSAGGKIWEDKSLTDWGNGDFRVFAGDLGNDVTEEVLERYFSVYSSLTRVHVVRDKRTTKTRGYGFLSFSDSNDYVRAMREMNGKYVGSRPIKLKKSQWRDRQLDTVRKKERERNAMGML